MYSSLCSNISVHISKTYLLWTPLMHQYLLWTPLGSLLHQYLLWTPLGSLMHQYLLWTPLGSLLHQYLLWTPLGSLLSLDQKRPSYTYLLLHAKIAFIAYNEILSSPIHREIESKLTCIIQNTCTITVHV